RTSTGFESEIWSSGVNSLEPAPNRDVATSELVISLPRAPTAVSLFALLRVLFFTDDGDATTVRFDDVVLVNAAFAGFSAEELVLAVFFPVVRSLTFSATL